MQQLMLAAAPSGATPTTMSSREIAELTGKRHGDVIRDIRAMLDALQKDDASLRHASENKDSRGYTAMFHLDRELTDTLLTGYSIPMRRKVIARWHELERAATAEKIATPAAKSGQLGSMATELSICVGSGIFTAQQAAERFDAWAACFAPGFSLVPKQSPVEAAPTEVEKAARPPNYPVTPKVGIDIIELAKGFLVPNDRLVPSTHIAGLIEFHNGNQIVPLFEHGLLEQGHRLSRPGSQRVTYRAMLTPLGRVFGVQSNGGPAKWYISSTLNYLRSVGVQWSDADLFKYFHSVGMPK